MPKHTSHLFVDDSIYRIFRLGEKGLEESEIPGEIQEYGESGVRKTMMLMEFLRCMNFSQDITTQSQCRAHIRLFLWVVMRGLGCAETSPNGLANVGFVKSSKISVRQGLRTKWCIICIGSRH